MAVYMDGLVQNKVRISNGGVFRVPRSGIWVRRFPIVMLCSTHTVRCYLDASPRLSRPFAVVHVLVDTIRSRDAPKFLGGPFAIVHVLVDTIRSRDASEFFGRFPVR